MQAPCHLIYILFARVEPSHKIVYQSRQSFIRPVEAVFEQVFLRMTETSRRAQGLESVYPTSIPNYHHLITD